MNPTAIDRFWPKLEKTNDCWLWRAAIDRYGYGKFNLNGKVIAAHRAAWELLRGPIPEGMEIDHLCRVRNCVRPDHLEPVSKTVNCYRGESFAAENRRKTHCSKGHPLAGSNVRITAKGYRICKQCDALRTKAYEERKSGAAS